MFARPSRSLAAVLATATVALAIGAGPLAGSAHAAPPPLSTCSLDKAGHVNSGTDTLTVSTSPTPPGALAPTDTVELVADAPSVANIVATNAGDPTAYTPGPVKAAIAAQFNLAAAAPTTYVATVYDNNHEVRGTCTSTTGTGGKYSIVGGAPTVTAFSKSARGKGTTTQSVVITGTNLAKEANVEFLTGGTVDSQGQVTGGTVDEAVTWTEGNATTATSMTGTLFVGSAAQSGQHILRFTNTDGQSYALANALNVSNAPSVTSLDWTALAIGASNRTVVVTGADFQPGLTVAFYTNGGSTTTPNTSDIVINGSPVVNSPTQVTLNVSIPSGATAGTKLDLKVTNPDAGTVTKAQAMTINAKPTVTDVTPHGRDAGSTGQVLTVTGTNFVTTVPQTVFTFDNGVTVTASNVTSPTSATITVSIASSAPAAARTITATNADGGVGTCTGTSTPKCFTVSAAPTISSISPPTLARGQSGTVTISGSNFTTGTYNAGNVSFGAGITVTSATWVNAGRVDATITVDSLAAQGSRTVTLTNPTTDTAGAGTATKNNAFSVAAISVTGANPASAANTNSRTLTISGGGFALGPNGEAPTVTLVPTSGIAAAQSPIVGTAVSNVTSSSLTATFALNAVTPGGYDISVVNNTGEAGSCSNCFTVFGGQPSVTSVTPSSRGAGAQNQVLSIVGTNFSHGATVSFPPTSGVTVDGTPTVVDSSHITVTVDIAGSATPGVANPTVTTAAPDSQSGTCIGGCFTVNAKPSVTSISPNARAIGSAPVTITVTGTGFQTGQTPTLSLGNGVTVSNVTVVNPTSVTATVAIANNAIPGPRDATVTNPDGGSSTTTNAFTVDAAPIINTVTPATIQRGATGVDITISGSNFNTTDTAVTFSGTGLTITQTTRTSANVVVVRVNADTAAPLGARDVTVTNNDGGNVTKANALSVLSNPVVTTVAPSAAAQGQTLDLTITGSGYDGTSLVSISGTGITLGTLTRSSATSLIQRITVASDAPTGLRAVNVTNGDGGTGSKADALTINPAPTVSSVSPASGQTRGTAIPVTITGTNFVSGATVSFGAGTTSTVTNTTSTTLSVSVTIASNATPGGRTVTVTNPDGGVGSKANGFTVLSDPTLTSVSPAAIGQGATRAVTLTGTGFSGPVTVAVSGTGVTVSGITLVNATTITATFAAADAAATGNRDVTVTNADGGTVTKAAALAVGAKPTISSVSPTTIQRGRVNRSMTITGTNFVAGAVPNLGTGITVNGTPTVTATQITVNVTVAGTSPLGAHDVSVTNPDQGKATSAGALTVTATRTFVITAPATAKSGDAQSVQVKAVDSDGTTTDTGYTGTPVLTSTDTHFTPGTCAAAVNGVSSCTGVVFNDLGSKMLTAAGTGNDADLGGTKPVKVTPTALVFTAAPNTAPRGTPVNFTVAPTAANSGTITGYSEPRTLTTTGDSSPTSGTVLTCSSAACTFPLSWSTGGSKTVQVSDGSLSTPVVTVVITAPSSLSSGVNKRVVPQRGSITLSGTMLNTDTGNPVGGQEIRIYRRVMPASSYSYVASVTTDVNGTYAYTATGLTRNTFFVARFMGNSSYAPSVAATRLAYVSAGITASIPTTVTAGRSLTINGRTSPAIPGGKIVLFERLSNGSLLALATTRARSDGSFTLVRPSGLSRGYHRLQAYVGGTSLNAANGTAFVTTRAV